MFRAPFLPDKEIELNFLSGFPYKETPDQVSAWEDISGDLSSGSPMDRLLCGDVGFGKTELAIRAAFRVALSDRRVVVLAPTTILANQLYSSFSSRLEPFAISVDIVSRFKVASEVGLVKKKIGDGCNNVLIGTHALLNDDIYLNNVGLLIIDEEHLSANTVLASDLIQNVIKPRIIMGVSATPQNTGAMTVEVPREDVIDSGLLKEKIIFQTEEDLVRFAGTETNQDEILLELAWQKRLELLQHYKDIGENINQY